MVSHVSVIMAIWFVADIGVILFMACFSSVYTLVFIKQHCNLYLMSLFSV